MSYSDSDSDSIDSWDVTSFKPVDLKKIYKCKLGISTIFEPAFVGNLKTAQDNAEGLIFVLPRAVFFLRDKLLIVITHGP